MGEYQTLQHTAKPVYDEHSKILILGTFPSVKSREVAFFYGHPRNRFWPVLAGTFDEPVPNSVPEKKALLLNHQVALWDVIASCDIIGSSDSSIKNVVPNDLSEIFNVADIKKILLNGQTAYKLYRKYCEKQIDLPFVILPSTSPANATLTLDDLLLRWKQELLSINDKTEM